LGRSDKRQRLVVPEPSHKRDHQEHKESKKAGPQEAKKLEKKRKRADLANSSQSFKDYNGQLPEAERSASSSFLAVALPL
jgi:hypothetical protein